MKRVLSMYNIPRFSTTLVYMLQSVEYQASPYFGWLYRTRDFSAIMQRRTLEHTRIARVLRIVLVCGMALQLLVALVLMYVGWHSENSAIIVAGAIFGVLYPLVWSHAIVLPLLIGRYFFVVPRDAKSVKTATDLFGQHTGKRIAVVGSYGKTSMKELLTAVLDQSLKVASTPGNMNVVSSHARFAASLYGDEDVLIIEFGEGKPGDVVRFSKIAQPTHAIITGLAPAHLDQYKTLQAAGEDIFSVADVVPSELVYVNGESSTLDGFLKAGMNTYTREGVMGWQASNAKTGLEGTSFELVKEDVRLELHSSLIGLHHVGPLALVAVLAMEFGLSPEDVQKGIANTKPFEHRMQPYRLSGAWVIDDTYNGNLEGIRVGTALLSQLTAKRKIYVTPGLVDQGEEVHSIHNEVGTLIASARPDIVILMKNSVTQYIQEGLTKAGYAGEVIVQPDPLNFYTHLDHFVAEGDVVLMQNDWTDNYA
jgi:UDP-N-acetylmuramoyl-tripeptide--D-alanyl-D-alanine ligase